MTPTDLLLDRMRTARRWTCDLLADVDESSWFTPPGPGLGHVAWQVGHIASSQIALIHVRCLGRAYADSAPAAYQALFGRGSKPVADPAAYPKIAEIRSWFNRVQEEALAMVRQMTPADLAAATHGEPHPMFTNRGGAVVMSAMHESFHAGQIALMRRLAGKAPLR